MLSWFVVKEFCLGAIITFWVIAFFLFKYSRSTAKRHVDKNSSAANIQFVHWSYIRQIEKLAWANWAVGVLIVLALVIKALMITSGGE